MDFVTLNESLEKNTPNVPFHQISKSMTYCETNCSNSTSGHFPVSEELPKEMQFGVQHVISITAYSCFFVIAAIGNLTVFITLFRNRNDKSRVNMFIMHLAMADMIVTFIMMPLEVVWKATVEWLAGDAACRILMFFRAFGLYLSSFVLVVISLDRYFAILYPLSLNDSDKRGKIMLGFAWLFSIVASIPQSVIFHEDSHPNHPWFKQCVTFGFFPTIFHENVYNMFTMIAMYGLPLIIITMSYLLILREISKKTRQSKEEMQEMNSSGGRLRRSAVGNIERARSKTLKMTLVIVGVFVFCWTPYYVLAVWYWFDRESARQLDPKIQNCLFIFAVSNSCVNPIVYGLFTINFKREFMRCCCCLKSRWRNARRNQGTDSRLRAGRSMYSKTTLSSMRSPSTANSSGLKIKMQTIPSDDSVCKFIVKTDHANHPNNGLCTPMRNPQIRDCRQNSNNFLVVHMKQEAV
ncbi:adipokinetic hormone/corazonin-related peptide receptor variant I-like [Ruditapes philippinarum]|uniref:adipokinetic hormone/corazonin-related peptide receptor variant I-like n=1 Tax=Ruditapes philippinarum TaxID=129788 RepID=UPI00295B23DC|nr:adipokinetic hormone/corazonin-related peptide receptor variant I-like [Ruditapes philippinarum]